MPLCKNCGSDQFDAARLCMQCGFPMEDSSASPDFVQQPFNAQASSYAAPPASNQEVSGYASAGVAPPPPPPPGIAAQYPPMQQNNAYNAPPESAYSYQQASPPSVANPYQQMDAGYNDPNAAHSYQQAPTFGAEPYMATQPNGYNVPGNGYSYQQVPPPMIGLTVGEAFRRAFTVFKRKPLKLWGLSLMFMLLTVVVIIFSVLPIISVPIILVLQIGMTAIYLDGYRGKEVDSNQLFQGFKNFVRNAGAMGWMALWLIIWGIIPVVGPIIATVKAYGYSFVPYILLNEPEISAVDALKKSEAMTSGYKGKMFITQILVILTAVGTMAVIGALSLIPFVGVVFAVFSTLVLIVIEAILPLVLGTLGAAFYDEAERASGK